MVLYSFRVHLLVQKYSVNSVSIKVLFVETYVNVVF